MAAARSIASLTLSFGLVAIPVRLYSATETADAIRFNFLTPEGDRVKQQYVSARDMKTVVPRERMVKGYEFNADQFVLFSAEELKALEEAASHVIEIVAFIPQSTVDPIYFDKAYYLAPDKRGGKPYSLLQAAMRKTGRCALAKWAWKGKQYIAQVRAEEDGMVLQQLLYAAEVRSLAELHIERVEPAEAELKLAIQLIDQISQDAYDPSQFADEERARLLAAIDRKIAGKEFVEAVAAPEQAGGGAQVIDLTEALMASLKKKTPRGEPQRASAAAARKGARRAAPKEDAAPASRARARK